MEIEEHFFTSAADADFQLHYERYGDVFYDAVDRAIERLRRFPGSGPTYEAPVRRLVSTELHSGSSTASTDAASPSSPFSTYARIPNQSPVDSAGDT